jgi:hypothetical protein
MQILVDSSVWIDYFRNGFNSGKLDMYIDQNLICINDLILFTFDRHFNLITKYINFEII